MRVLPIKLIGYGTREIESFASFIHRSAREHGVSVGVFINHVLEMGKHDGLVDSNAKLPKYMRPQRLMKAYNCNTYLVNILSKYTEQDLLPSTLWYMQNLMLGMRHRIEIGFRWCPECISEQLNSGKTVYFKVKWHMTDIKICSYHRTLLISRCQFCGNCQTSYVVSREWGSCVKCGISLGMRKVPVTPDDMHCSWKYECDDLEELIEDMMEVKRSEFTYTSVVESLRTLEMYIQCKIKGGEEKRYRDDLYKKIIMKDNPSLKLNSIDNVRKLACTFGTSIYNVISNQYLYSSELLGLKELCHEIYFRRDKIKRINRDHDEVCRNLIKLINNPGYHPSLKETARSLNVSVGYLEYRFPHQVNQITSQYKSMIRKEAEQRKRQAISYAMKFFYSEKYSSYNKSRKQAYRIIREETGLPKFMLREAIQRAYEIYYSE